MVEYTGREVLLKDENGEVIIPYVNVDNILNEKAVLKTGDQEIGGLKTFTNDIVKIRDTGSLNYILEMASYTMGTAPSENLYGCYRTNDSNKAEIANFYYRIDTSGDASVRMMSKNIDGSKSHYIGLGFKGDGTFYTYAPPCALQNSIVTTSLISKSGNGYVKLGNGIIIQWGRTGSIGHDANATISLPLAFTSTNYSIIPVNYNTTTSSESINVRITAKTTTNFGVKTYRIETKASGTRYIDWVAIGY